MEASTLNADFKLFSNHNTTIIFLMNYLSEFSWSKSLYYFASCCIIFGGVLPYVPQYLDILKSGNVEGFSTLVCFVLLTANILRIIFWYGNPFEFPLLVQSIVMILAMLAMVELCVRVKNRSVTAPTRNRYFTDDDDESREILIAPNDKKICSKKFWDLNYKDFWQWTDFISYVECMATLAIIIGLFMYFFIYNYYFVQAIGFLALITESILGLPQLIVNHKNKSTAGMDKYMVIMWLVSDLLKTAYFIYNSTPVQFWVCGFIQISIDIFILGQVFLYGQNKYRKIDKNYK